MFGFNDVLSKLWVYAEVNLVGFGHKLNGKNIYVIWTYLLWPFIKPDFNHSES